MRRQQHLLTLGLLACALFLRALVPAGWMPAPTGGAFAIEPCPAAAPQLMVQMAGHHGAMPADHGSSHKHQGGDACFSALLVGFAPVDQPAFVHQRALIAEPHANFSAAPAFKTGPPAPPPPSTGPPSLA